MHTPTRSACRPLSSLALMAALGALPLAAAAQQGTPAASAPASVAPQAAGQPAPQAASQNVAQTASQPGSQTSGQGVAQPSATSPAGASAVTSTAAPASLWRTTFLCRATGRFRAARHIRTTSGFRANHHFWPTYGRWATCHPRSARRFRTTCHIWPNHRLRPDPIRCCRHTSGPTGHPSAGGQCAAGSFPGRQQLAAGPPSFHRHAPHAACQQRQPASGRTGHGRYGQAGPQLLCPG